MDTNTLNQQVELIPHQQNLVANLRQLIRTTKRRLKGSTDRVQRGKLRDKIARLEDKLEVDKTKLNKLRNARKRVREIARNANPTRKFTFRCITTGNMYGKNGKHGKEAIAFTSYVECLQAAYKHNHGELPLE